MKITYFTNSHKQISKSQLKNHTEFYVKVEEFKKFVKQEFNCLRDISNKLDDILSEYEVVNYYADEAYNQVYYVEFYDIKNN